VLDDLDVCGVDVRVGLDEVLAEGRGELLGRVDGVLLREDVNGLLLGVCGNDGAVVCFGVAVEVRNVQSLESDRHLRSLNVALEEGADGLLDDGVYARLFVLVNLVQANVVLAVLGVAELRHAG
jgi:hypothetical protein